MLTAHGARQPITTPEPRVQVWVTIKKSVFDVMRDNPGHQMPPDLVEDLVWATKYTCDDFELDRILTIKFSQRHVRVKVQDEWSIAQVKSQITRLQKNDVQEN